MVLPKNELMEKIKTSNTIQNKTIFQTCQKRWDAVLNCLVTDWRYGLVKADHYRPIEEQNLIQPLLTIPLVSVSFLSVGVAKQN